MCEGYKQMYPCNAMKRNTFAVRHIRLQPNIIELKLVQRYYCRRKFNELILTGIYNAFISGMIGFTPKVVKSMNNFKN